MDTQIVSYDIAFNDMGCYADNPGDRTLKGPIWGDQRNMTHEWCATTCAQLEWSFFGLENGRECGSPLSLNLTYCIGFMTHADIRLGFCGNEISTSAIPVECVTCQLCWGDKSQCCGDSNKISIFSLVSTRTTASTADTTSIIPSSSTQSASESSATVFSAASTPTTQATTTTTPNTSNISWSQTNSTVSIDETSIYSCSSSSSASSTVGSH